MSLTKLLKAPVKLFQKDVISFLIVRRFDLGVNHEIFRYISVKPNASTSVLRQKIWHLLDLPDYCDEIIILKMQSGIEIPLSELKRGNSPERPFVLEVWLQNKQENFLSTLPKNMITMGNKEHSYCNEKSPESFSNGSNEGNVIPPKPAMAKENIEMNNRNRMYTKHPQNTLYADYEKSEVSCKISSTSIFKMNRKKSKDNFTVLLLKIQNDLSTLSNKLSVLENKIPAH